MDSTTFYAFADEIVKIAKTLNKDEEREQVAKFTGLGAAAMPAAAGASNLIAGRGLTAGAKLRRWVPAQALVGAVMGGGMPAIRHQIERGMQDKAKERREAEKAQASQGIK
jgi:hypothetical protein